MKDNPNDAVPNTSHEPDADAQFREYIEEAMAEEKQGSREAAMLAMMRALTVAAENLEESNSPRDQLLKRQLLLEEACDWPAVIAVRREIIRYLETEVPAEKPDAPPHYAPFIAAEGWRMLSESLSLIGNNDEALAAVDRAIQYARQADMSPLVVQSLLQRARNLGRLGRWREALASATEALAANEPELPFIDGQIARCRVLMAGCHARLHEPASARKQLALVKAILERPQLNPLPLRAGYAEARAETQRAEGDLAGAIASLQEAVTLWQANEQSACGSAVNACAATARSLKRLAEFFDEHGDAARASEARHQVDEFSKRFKLPVWS